jgi:hypothetical protein
MSTMNTPPPTITPVGNWMAQAMQQQQQEHDARMRAMMSHTPTITPSLAGEASFMTADHMLREQLQREQGQREQAQREQTLREQMLRNMMNQHFG